MSAINLVNRSGVWKFQEHSEDVDRIWPTMLNASGVELIIPHGHDARGLLPKEQYLL